jgi:hypothetical protein
MESNRVWKEKSQRRPYYDLLCSAPAASSVQANWHGVPVAKEDVIVTLSPEFLAQHVIPPYSAQLVISFEDKLGGDSARKWVAEYAVQCSLDLKLQKCFPSRFHLLQIFGPNPHEVKAQLLAETTLNLKGWHTVLSPMCDTTDLDQPVGLKQLLFVSFHSSFSWLKDCLDVILAPLGTIVRYTKSCWASVSHYHVLLVYTKSYFEKTICIVLPERTKCLDLNYKGLAL